MKLIALCFLPTQLLSTIFGQTREDRITLPNGRFSGYHIHVLSSVKKIVPENNEIALWEIYPLEQIYFCGYFGQITYNYYFYQMTASQQNNQASNHSDKSKILGVKLFSPLCNEGFSYNIRA